MTGKPRHEDLERRVKVLERIILRLERAQMRLRDSNQQWETIFEAIGDPVCLLDAEYKILRCNKAMATFLQKPVAEIIGQRCWELVHGTTEPVEGCPTVRMWDTRHRETAVLPINDKWFEIVAHPQMDAQGNIIEVVHTLSEITEHMHAEKALKESEERSREVAELLPQPVFEIDMAGFFTYSNRSGFETFGYTREDLEKGVHALQLFHPEERERVERNIQKRLTGVEFEDHEYIGLRKDGSTFPILIYTCPIIRDEKTVGVRGIVLDITERKQAEEALRKAHDKLEKRVIDRTAELTRANEMMKKEIEERKLAEEKLKQGEKRIRLILDSIPAYVLQVDGDLKILLANKAALELNPDAIGQYCYKAFPNLNEPCNNCPVVKCLKSGRIESGLVHHPKVTGVTGASWWSLTGVPLKDQTGEIKGAIEFSKNITENKLIEERLRQSQKMEAIATLAGGIAHEFNNALSGVIGYIELLQMDYPDDEKIGRYSDEMKKSSYRMAGLTNQLLAYAQGGKYRPVNTSLNEFIENTLPLIRHRIAPEIHIEMDPDTEILTINADLTQMQMVLSAILLNASEAIDGKGKIKVITRRVELDEEFVRSDPGLNPGVYACLAIEDDGRGMDEETRSKIFEPFFTTKFQGRGLGMAAAYGTIRNHNGSIFVDSEPGKGTRIRIYLPAVEAEIKEEKGPSDEFVPGSETILVIEDEKIVMDVIQSMLKKLGYRVLEAATGTEAIDIARSYDGNIDLALLDIKLPDMEGGEIYPVIKKARPNLKVIVCSGYAIDGPGQDILDSGAQDFIQKPYSFTTLSLKIRKVLEGK